MKREIQNIVHHSEVSEKMIERYLTEKVKEAGGICLKYANPNMTGFPDRVCLFPHGVTVWVELKSKGKKPTKLQALRHKMLQEMGHSVAWMDEKAGVDAMIELIKFVNSHDIQTIRISAHSNDVDNE